MGVFLANSNEFDVVIVGAGFSGVYQLIRLREEGFKVHLLEASGGLGGIWQWNCYPGARVDTHCEIYQFSRKELWSGWRWKERFPGWSEMRAYFDYVGEKLDLLKDVSLNCRLSKARFNENTDSWGLEVDTGSAMSAKFIVICTGFASKPFIPKLDGMGLFEGDAHHTALWPQDGLDLKGKRVAVIGTGASGIQVAQEAALVSKHLTVFQRTPNMYLPMGQKDYGPKENERMKEELPGRFKRRGECFGGFDFDFIPTSGADVSDVEREETYEKLWQAGGFNFWLGTYHDVFTDEKVNRTAYEFWKKKTRERIKDKDLAEKLAPTEPPHPYAVKRPSLEQWYFDIFNYENTELVSLRDEPIVEMTKSGIVTSEREYEFDIVVFATGFDAVTGGLTSIDIADTDGNTLGERWSDGVKTHLGLATSKFPNMLMGYGPQAPTGFCNGPSSAEYQGECIIELLMYIRDKKFSRFETEESFENIWREKIAEIADQTLFPKADSWYMGANIPGKKKEMLMYPGGLPKYLEEFRHCAAHQFEGFKCS